MYIILSLLYALISAPIAVSASVRTIPLNTIVTTCGTYRISGGTCSLSLAPSWLSEAKVLRLHASDRDSVTDVTAVVWVSKSTIVYSVSPIYGDPGIYIRRCDGGRPRRVAGNRKRGAGRAQSNAYYALTKIRKGTASGLARVEYWFKSDVDTDPQHDVLAGARKRVVQVRV